MPPQEVMTSRGRNAGTRFEGSPKAGSRRRRRRRLGDRSRRLRRDGLGPTRVEPASQELRQPGHDHVGHQAEQHHGEHR